MSGLAPKVLIVARYPRPWGIGPCYFRAFRRLGYEARLHLLHGEKSDGFWPRALRRLDITRAVLRRTALESLAKEVKDFRPDLILSWKADDFDRTSLQELREPSKAVLFCIYTDNPIADRGFPAALEDSFHTTIREFDCVFSSARSWVPILYLCGGRRVEHHPFACDPETHHPVEVTAAELEAYQSPVAYLGSYPNHHERWLQLLLPFGLNIWGDGWWRLPITSVFRKCWQKPGSEGRGVGTDMAKVCSASAIIFNMIRAQHGCAHSLKTFEIPACGGFMLSNRTDEQREFFEEDKSAVYFSSEEELIDKVKFYLKHAAVRKTIAERGRQCAQNHTFVHRVPHIVKVYEELR